MAIPRPVRTALTATCNGYVASPEQIEAERQAEAESADPSCLAGSSCSAPASHRLPGFPSTEGDTPPEEHSEC